MARLFYAANIGALYHNISWDDLFDDPGLDEVKLRAHEYIGNFEDNLYYGRGITFDGPLGTGKSFMATLILKELLKMDYTGYFITFDDLLTVQSQGWKEAKFTKEFYDIRGTQILVVDELFAVPGGAKKELLADTLERVIRYRVHNRLPTIITTNLSPEQERDAYPRVASLLATAQVRITMNGEDQRKNRVRELTDSLIKSGERRPIR